MKTLFKVVLSSILSIMLLSTNAYAQKWQWTKSVSDATTLDIWSPLDLGDGGYVDKNGYPCMYRSVNIRFTKNTYVDANGSQSNASAHAQVSNWDACLQKEFDFSGDKTLSAEEVTVHEDGSISVDNVKVSVNDASGSPMAIVSFNGIVQIDLGRYQSRNVSKGYAKDPSTKFLAKMHGTQTYNISKIVAGSELRFQDVLLDISTISPGISHNTNTWWSHYQAGTGGKG